jgi:hypothetical protein
MSLGIKTELQHSFAMQALLLCNARHSGGCACNADRGIPNEQLGLAGKEIVGCALMKSEANEKLICLTNFK